MEISKAGLQLIAQFEACCLTAYQDVRGIWTIGVGHTGPEVIEGLVWTQGQADAQLMKDTQHAANIANRAVKVTLTQGQFDALCSFIFNVGSGNFLSSTLLTKLNSGDYVGAAGEFERWDKSGGVVVAGLLRRRIAEEQEFNS